MPITYSLLLCLLLLVCTTSATSHGEGESSSNGCTVSDTSYLISAINSTEGYNLTRAIINCLEYSDNRSTLSFGSISYETMAGTNGRYTVQCNSGLLLLSVSDFWFSEESSSCYECVDAEDSCVSGTDCPQYCDHCLSASECLHCTYARYKGLCLPNTSCPNNGVPNPMNGNECECTQEFSGDNCSVCALTECEIGYTLNNLTNSCQCVESCPSGSTELCQSGCKFLVDPNSTVPQSVIGSPDDVGEGGGHHKRARGGGNDSHGTSDTDTDRAFCVQRCLNDWEPDSNGVCYACGISYCLECNANNDCTKCRSGTLLKTARPQNHCVGFYALIRELNEALQEEEHHEEEILKQQQLELIVALPIFCFFLIASIIVATILAHKRYPHVEEEKRYKDPTKIIVINRNTLESGKLQSQSTVRQR
ncbi:PREDICTED: neurogenic locus notch homolog protein 1-like [Amphimedon queenslandica]|uniref:EGF-like domain-containing protein n=1 Tax=Amphimedon queenslandica TaxID=400682 RepID=A0AAN0J645_AMPQE|nr:PREDICTED: neurogenic locus notch homolog protein 1-like [Amphimedon queenslandica]|eukprot:XP_019852494.1 PREDICTED: neurogenic locus notch homolog protein 1-like [Amphimedon queenslandica]